MADVVDRQLEAYLGLHGVPSSWGTQERILVCMTPRANAARMLASGRRNADRFHGELFAIYVMQDNLTAEDRMALERNVDAGPGAAGARRDPGRKGSDRAILDYARSPRHHADLRRPQPPAHAGDAAWRHAARSPDSRCRRHGRPRIPAVTVTNDRARGRLKVFLGYAAGVGKTYQMLTEAHELKDRGVDVVVGYFEPHARTETIALSEGLETVPRTTVEYRGTRFEEMDTDASCGGTRRSPSSTSFRTPTCPDRRG